MKALLSSLVHFLPKASLLWKSTRNVVTKMVSEHGATEKVGNSEGMFHAN